MNRAISRAAALGAICLLTACGHETLNTQESQRSAFDPELQGGWVSLCEGKQINRLAFQEGRLTVERTTYYDTECQDPVRTTKQSGNYKLAHTFKQGVLNSIIFHGDPAVAITFHTDDDVDAQNNNIARIQNENEQEIPAGTTPAERKRILRENLKLRAAKQLTVWQKGQEKILNRLQAEKLEGLGLAPQPAVEMDTRKSLRYELDNGYLQFAGGGDFGRVYSKQ